METAARDQIQRAPQSAGVYLLKGEGGRVLYVGKAVRLRDRLRSYLTPERDTRPSISLMVPLVKEVEWLLTDNEKEALLLENSLIKEHRPRYNVDLRDDKSYVSLRLTKHTFPRLFVTRKIIRDGSEYFGPYASAADLRETLKLVQKIFLVRDCTDPFFANRSRPCLRYQIKRCSAPCVNYVSSEAYAGQVHQVKMFLAGNKDDLVRRLREEMKAASEAQKYEEAGILRDRVRAVEGTLEPQKVESRADERNADAVGMAGDGQATLVKVLKIRRGRLVGADEFFMEEPVSAAAEITRAFLQQYYLADASGREIPSQLLLASEIPDRAAFESLFRDRAGRKVEILRPQRGRAVKLLKLAERNAAASLAERKRKSERSRGALAELQGKLGLKAAPKRIEGYDISAFHGASPVGSMVVFTDGEPDKAQYRHYGIKTVKGSNDFAMLKEMFERRFKKLRAETRPDLVLVDGGRGQLRQALDVLKALGIEGLDVISIAKEKELRSKSGKKYAPERLFLPGRKNPLIFPPSAPSLHLLQRVRDEAHRFGITRHRKSRGSAALASVLRRIPGIGPKRLRALLKTLGSAEKIRGATLEELQSAPGVTRAAAEAVLQFFRQETEE